MKRQTDSPEIIRLKTGSGQSRILANASFKDINRFSKEGKRIFITDENIHKLYSHLFPPYHTIVIGTGEKTKTLAMATAIYKKMISAEVDRSWTVIGVGGGIVCDLTGFVASTYMRGLPLGFVATSLLAQVDASIGGKNGVNLLGYKNMIGIFRQPEFVICDINMLATLPETEWLNGLAEIVKYGLIADRDLFNLLEKHRGLILKRQKNIIAQIIKKAIGIKALIVMKDERENGERKKLNFGHTLAHALEKTVGIPHGQAVAMGIAWAARISRQKKMLPGKDHDRIEKLLQNLQLAKNFTYSPAKVMSAMRKDKKRCGQDIDMILLKKIGRSVITRVNLNELKEVVHDLRQCGS